MKRTHGQRKEDEMLLRVLVAEDEKAHPPGHEHKRMFSSMRQAKGWFASLIEAERENIRSEFRKTTGQDN